MFLFCVFFLNVSFMYVHIICEYQYNDKVVSLEHKFVSFGDNQSCYTNKIFSSDNSVTFHIQSNLNLGTYLLNNN